MILTDKLTIATTLLHLILELHQNCILTLSYQFKLALVANPGLEMHTYFLFYEESTDNPKVHTGTFALLDNIAYRFVG